MLHDMVTVMVPPLLQDVQSGDEYLVPMLKVAENIYNCQVNIQSIVNHSSFFTVPSLQFVLIFSIAVNPLLSLFVSDLPLLFYFYFRFIPKIPIRPRRQIRFKNSLYFTLGNLSLLSAQIPLETGAVYSPNWASWCSSFFN